MNTIYDGSFVLGQTSATNFIAGPGIKIDEPSEGTVRIGNDETVLWSGTRTNSVTLSESAYNFELIRIEFDEGQVNAPNPVIVLKPNQVMSTGFCYGVANAFLGILYISLTNGITLTIENTKSIRFGSFTSTSTTLAATLNDEQVANSICKVVGINRKEV